MKYEIEGILLCTCMYVCMLQLTGLTCAHVASPVAPDL